MKTKLLSLFVALIATTALWASKVITYTAASKLLETTSSSYLALHTNAFNVAISSHTFSNGTGTITFAGEVTTIGNYAFYGCSGLTSVTIPNSVTTIGEEAFVVCSGLTSITIPNSVTTIGNRAFYGCSGLTSVTIPNSVTTIGKEAFSYCSGLTKTNYTGTIADWCKIKFGGFNANPMNYSHNFYINDVEVKDLVIPEGVNTIGDYAFDDCTGLTSVTIGNSVTTIGDRAFYWCSGLTSVTIPSSVTTIGSQAFEACRGLTSVTIPSSVTTIEDGAFDECTGLTSVTIPNSVTTIGYYAFYGCTNLATVFNDSELNITKGSSGYGYVAYYAKNVYNGIPKGDFVIKNDTILNGYIGNDANVTIPNSVTTIGKDAFSGCSGLTSVTIPNSVTTIGSNAFRSCSGLTSVTIPNSVTTIGSSAFAGCNNIASVTWNAKDCSGYNFGNQVKSFTFGNEVEKIPSNICKNMDKLTSIVIPHSVTMIGDNAFYNCSVRTITCYAVNPPTATGTTFNGISQYTKTYVLASSLENYQFAIGWRDLNLFPIEETGIFPVLYNEKEGLGSDKFIKDGRLLIERDGILYNAHGAKVK